MSLGARVSCRIESSVDGRRSTVGRARATDRMVDGAPKSAGAVGGREPCSAVCAGRMIETIRKGYRQADDPTRTRLLEEYVGSVATRGAGYSEFTCGNPRFLEYVLDEGRARTCPDPRLRPSARQCRGRSASRSSAPRAPRRGSSGATRRGSRCHGERRGIPDEGARRGGRARGARTDSATEHAAARSMTYAGSATPVQRRR